MSTQATAADPIAAISSSMDQFAAVSSIFDAAEMVIYVADMDTNELLFMNTHAARRSRVRLRGCGAHRARTRQPDRQRDCYSQAHTPVHAGVEAHENEVAVTVTDRGVGIGPDELPKLFQRYYRANNSKADGLGLGLHNSRMLMESNAGRIWAESTPGGGSTFRLALPRSGDAGAQRPVELPRR